MRMRNVKRWLTSLLCVAMLFSTLSVFGAVPKAKAVSTYDGEAGAAWGRANYKGKYNYSCATFASQCLNAGGFTDVYDAGCTSLRRKLLATGVFVEYPLEVTKQKIYPHSSANNGKVSVGDVLLVHKRGSSTYVHAYVAETVNDGPLYVVQTSLGDVYGSRHCWFDYNGNTTDYEIVSMHYTGKTPEPDPNRDELGCTTAYAGWYQVTYRTGASVNSGHNKNWNSKVGEIPYGQYVYISKATGTGSGNLGHITYNGVERYIAMGMLTRMSGNPIGAVENFWGEEGNVRLTGWAFDWDNCEAQLQINVYLDSELVYQGKAEAERTDINQAYSNVVGSYHGYNFWISTNKTGNHSYSVYAINVGSGDHTCIGSGTVNIPAPVEDLCSTAYAGWYYVSADKVEIHSEHNLSSSIREAIKDQRVYVTKATGTGVGQLGHITLSDGKEYYIAMAGLTRLTGVESEAGLTCANASGGYIISRGSAYNWDDLNEKVTVRIVADSGQEVTVVANQSGYNPLYRWSVLTPNEESQGDNHNFTTKLGVLSGGKHTIHVYVYSSRKGGWIETETQELEVDTVTKLDIESLPAKTEYSVGDTLDTTGLKLKATCELTPWPAMEREVTGDFTCTPMVLNAAGEQTITVNYRGETTTFKVHVKSNDTEAPVISDVQVTNVTTEGYDVSCTVTDNVGVNRVQFPTWTDANGQDDLLSDWSINPKASGTRNGDTWTFHVSIADHNNERGKYITHIYAYDDAGNIQSNINVASGVEVPVPNPTLTFDANGGTAEFDTKQAERGAAYGALPEAWMDGYVFDGWYTDAVGGSRVSSSTVYTAAGHTTLYAHWMPVASDAEQGWSLQDGTLIITSQGAMQDYTSARETPWFSDRADIRKIVVQNGVTSIGNYAFYGCENVTSVALPSTVTQIGKLAFYGCRNLSSLTLPDSLTMVEDYAFAKASGLGTIAFKGSAPLFGAGVFADVSAEVRYPAEDSTWTDAVRQSYTGNVSWAGVSEAELTVQTSDLQLNDPELEALLADSCV